MLSPSIFSLAFWVQLSSTSASVLYSEGCGGCPIVYLITQQWNFKNIIFSYIQSESSVKRSLPLVVYVCFWLCTSASGCVRVPLVVYVCLWLCTFASGCVRVPLVVYVCLWLCTCASGCVHALLLLCVPLCLWTCALCTLTALTQRMLYRQAGAAKVGQLVQQK